MSGTAGGATLATVPHHLHLGVLMADNDPTSVGTKTCARCDIDQARTAFYSDSSSTDGLKPHCKACHAKGQKIYRAKYAESIRAKKAVWARANRSKLSATDRAWRVKHPERVSAHRRKFNSDNPEKRKAHYVVQTALRNGSMKRPPLCSACDATGRIEGHHEDYSKPLEVTWLCKPCHHLADVARGER